MKKIVFILSLVFVAGLTMSSYASQVTVDNDVKISIVEDNDDKKPCPADCTKACCTKEAKAECTKTEAKKECCSATKTTECTKSKAAEKKAAPEKSSEDKK